MTRIAVFGLGPMRFEQSTRLFALGLRTWHFAKTLARAGHEVLLFSVRGNAYEGWPADKKTHLMRDGVEVWSVSEHLCHERPAFLRRTLARFSPDCVIGVNRDPAAVAVNFAGSLPFWADVNGDPMAEAQAKAHALGHDDLTPEWHRKFLPVLSRADRFSTCSRAQRMALIGQLGMVGRLTAKNDGYDLVSAVPNSVDEEELTLFSQIERVARKPGEPFRLLWSGGFNTWCDPDTLFRALELAMAQAPELHFVATGGGIPGHHLDAYTRFEKQVEASRFRHRFELSGWVQTSELFGYYQAAHAAVLVDRFSYEGVLGARTRMLDWLAAGLPIVSTRLSEISLELEQRKIALVVEPGDARGLAEAMLRFVRQPRLAVDYGARGRDYARRELTAALQLGPVLDWASAPIRAPDGEGRARVSATPASVHELLKHALLFREEVASQGFVPALQKTRDFALRRVKNGVLHTVEAFTSDAPPPSLARSNEPSLPAPQLQSIFDWRKTLAAIGALPEVAAVVCVRGDEEPDYVDWTLEQLRRQYYPKWHALVVTPANVRAPIVERLAALASRFGDEPSRLSVLRGVDQPLDHAVVRRAKYLMLLAPGDLLRADALAQMVVIAERGRADLVYANEQELDETNRASPVQHKLEQAVQLLWHQNSLGRGALLRRQLVEAEPQRLTTWPFAAVHYDVLLRARTRVRRVLSTPEVLLQVHVPALRPEAERVALEQDVAQYEERALREAVWRESPELRVERGATPRTFRVRRQVDVATRVSVLCVDHTPDSVERLRVELAQSTGLDVDWVVASPKRTKVQNTRRFRTVAVPERADFGTRCDALLEHARGSFVVVCDSTVDSFRSGWLEALVEHALGPGVVSVSPRLVHTDGRVAWPEPLPGWPRDAPRGMPAPSAVCALYRRKSLERAQGFGKGAAAAVTLHLAGRLTSRGEPHVHAPEAVVYVADGSVEQ